MKKITLMKRLISMMLIIAMTALIATGCGVPGGSDNAGGQGTENEGNTDKPQGEDKNEPKKLKFSILSEPEAMDPQDGADTTSKIIRGGIYEGLMCWRDGKITPAAAESYEVSPDGLTYTFKIRKDAKWWDGKDLTAQDFVDGTIRLISPDGPNGGYAYYGYFLVNGEKYHKGEITDKSMIGVKALDEKTIEFKLHQPVPYFLSLNASGFFLPVRLDFVEKYGKEFVADADKVMGNGPFKLTSWNHEQGLTFEKFDGYWDKDSIKLDQVEMIVIAEANTALNMYENGELDLVTIPPELVQMYEKEGHTLYYEKGSETFLEVNYKSKSPAAKLLANKNFRKALIYAIDRQALVDAVCKDGSVPALRYVPNSMAVCGTTWGEKFNKDYYPAEGDVAKAKEYLQKALDEVGMKIEDVPELEIMTGDNSGSKVMTEALQDVFSKNLGLKIKITLYQSKQLWPTRSRMEFDMVYMSNGADYNDPGSFLERATYENNRVNYESEKFNKLFVDSSAETDENKRADILLEMEDLLMEDLPYIPIYFAKFAWLKKDYVQGVSRGVISDIDPNYIYADIVK